MASHRNKKNSDDDFTQYRQVAPESFSDESLRILMKSKDNNKEAILAAIQNLWHDIPDQQFADTEWQSASKNKAKDTPVATKPSTRQGDSGGRGGGRSARSSTGGRGSGAADRDRKSNRPASSSTPPVANPSPVNVEPSVPTNVPVEPVVHVAPVKPTATAAAPASVPVNVTTTASKPAWSAGTSFVEKMKKDEAEKAKAAAAAAAAAALEAQKALEAAREPVVVSSPENVPESTSDAKSDKKGGAAKTRTRKPKPAGGKKSSETEVSEELAKVELEPSEAPVAAPRVESSTIDLPANSDINASAESFAPASSLEGEGSNGFLKLGKWEAPVASSEMFQFGSFGNFQQDSEDKTNAWGKTAEDTVSSVVHDESAWNTTSDQVNLGSNQMGSLFSQPASSAASSNAATRAPPGLEQKQQQQQQGNRGANNQKYNKDFQQVSQQIPQQPILYPQQYGPPGIAPGVGNRNAAANIATPPAYPYNAAFDLTQSQFSHPNFGAAGITGAPLPSTSNTTSAAAPAMAQTQANTNTNNLQQQQQQQQQTQQLQQQQFNAAYGFNAAAYNPYYNPYFYNQTPPNFYGQNGRGVYQQQQQRPYGSDPYGSNAYSDLYQNQFNDAYGSNNNSSLSGAANASKTNKTGTSNPTQDMNAAHAYGNPYFNNPNTWYQGQQAQGWGAPMMFPNAPTGSQGFVQQPPHLQQVPQGNASSGQRQGGVGSLNTTNRNTSGASTNTGTQGPW